MKLSGKNLKAWKLISIFIVAAGLLVFLVFFRVNIENSIAGVIKGPSGALFSRISFLSSFLSELKKIRQLTMENMTLREENLRLLSEIAVQTRLKEDNIFLRQALNIPIPADYKLIDAGIYNVKFTSSGHNMLINKGLKDGIKKDAVIILSSGVLVGIVTEVSENYSAGIMVTNPDFKATISVRNTNTSGIARGDLQNGNIIDFVSQGDDIKEGDIVVTQGNDLFPPGFIIGQVSYIGVDDGSLFKKIIVKPMAPDADISRVLILIR